MKRILAILTILAILAGGGYFVWKWYFQKQESVDAWKLIPSNAVFVVETSEPVEGWKTFGKSEMWQHIKHYKPLGEIGQMADAVSETIEDNNLIFSVFGHRQVLISAHVTAKDNYDFLYVCDMEEGGKFSSVKDGIVGLLKNAGFQYTQSNVLGTDAHHFFDPKDKSTLNMAFVGNQLICSYSAVIFRNSLESKDKPELAENAAFTEITSATSSEGLCRIYLNHQAVPDFLNVYLADVSGLRNLFGSMQFTGAAAEIDDNLLSFKGYTKLNDSMSSHLKALHQSGRSKTKAQTVLSQRTGFMLSMGFQSFPKFYENLKEVLKKDEKEWALFNASKRKVETLLRFKLEEDLLSWIDDEVTLAQYQQDRIIGNEVYNVVAIKALSEEKAMEKLGLLEKRLKLFGKFKTEKYKGHEVHYMEIRGLFKLLFGKLFDKIEKPYYTVINGYVIFCDDALSLLQTIDDYENKKTLSSEEDFASFIGEFKAESSILTYVNMKKYFLNLKGILDGPSYATSYQNREYIICFPHIGFQLSAEDEMFDTRMSVAFAKPNDYEMEITEGKPLSREDLENLDSMGEAEAFLLNYINGSVRKEFYDNGQVKIVAETKLDVLHGRYLEYWENGTLKTKGRYKDGEKTGKWFYYNDKGDLEKKENFRKGEPELPDVMEEPI